MPTNIVRGGHWRGRIYSDSFMGGHIVGRNEYPRLEAHQVLNLPPMPHTRCNKWYDRTQYKNHGVRGDGSDSSKFPAWKTTPRGIGASYDGVDDFHNCGNHESFDITDEITIEMWLKNLSIPANDAVTLVKPSSCRMVQKKNSLAKYRFDVYVDGAWREGNDYTIGDSEWHHIVGTYAESTRILNLYVDGSEVKRTTLSGLGDYYIGTSGDNLQLNSWGNKAEDIIDEVRIYNRANSNAKAKDDSFRYS